jgi:protocatechuate 3,4-dioxygenase beta subunit
MLSAQKTGYAAPGPGGAPNRPIEVAAGEHRSDASIVLLRGAVITGRVLDAAGQPLADARVTALRRPPVPPAGAAGRGPMAPPMMMVPGGSVQANDLGEFRLHSLAPGEYFIQAAPQSAFGAQASGDRTVLAPTFYPGTTSMSAAQGVTVTGGQTYGEIVVRLVTAVTYQISGIVVDQNGAPVEGAMVSLMPDRSTTPMPMMMMGPNGRIRTDAAGRFTVNGVLDGQYTIAAAAPIVLTRSNGSTGASGGISFGASGNVSGVVSGSAAASVARGTSTMTETTANGVTTQFRTEQADQVALTINGADVTGLQLVAPRR